MNYMSITVFTEEFGFFLVLSYFCDSFLSFHYS